MSIVFDQKAEEKRERLEDARIKRADKRWAMGRLVAAEDARSRRNHTEHGNGEHVGTRHEVTGCIDCKFWGDLMRWDLDTDESFAAKRAFLLERNISATIEAMRDNAALAGFELGLGFSVEVAD